MTRMQGWLLLAVVALCAGVYLWGQMDHRSSIERTADESHRAAMEALCDSFTARLHHVPCPR